MTCYGAAVLIMRISYGAHLIMRSSYGARHHVRQAQYVMAGMSATASLEAKHGGLIPPSGLYGPCLASPPAPADYDDTCALGVPQSAPSHLSVVPGPWVTSDNPSWNGDFTLDCEELPSPTCSCARPRSLLPRSRSPPSLPCHGQPSTATRTPA